MISSLRKQTGEKDLDSVQREAQRNSALRRVGPKNAIADKTGKQVAGAALAQTTHARGFPSGEFAPLQDLFKNIERLGLKLAASSVAFESVDQGIEVEHSRHEQNLIEAHAQKPCRKVDQRPAGEVSAPVEIPLTRHVGVVHHAIIVTATLQSPRETA